MPIYAEGILWYLVLLDCIAYNVLCWNKNKWHNKLTHWISEHFPLNKFMGLWYLLLVLWLGFALLRMEIILFQ